MTENITTFLMTTWDDVRDHIPEKKRKAVAIKLIQNLVTYEFIENASDLDDLIGQDKYIDEGIDSLHESKDDYEDTEELPDTFNDDY